MATEPFRLRVLIALTEALQQIMVSSGYKHDLGGNPLRVIRGRLVFGANDPLPMLSILEVPIPLDQVESPETSSLNTGVWDLMIQGFVEDDPKHPTDPAHRLMADVVERLAKERKKAMTGTDMFGLNGAVSKMTIGRGVVRPPDPEVSAKAYFWLSLSLTLVEDLAEPYADA